MKRYFIHTFGCQMNVNDTLRMGEVLAKMSYAPTPDADNADLIMLNTCAIREKAEDKMLSALGRYRPGEAAARRADRRGRLRRAAGKGEAPQEVPYVDFVFGPDAIGKLPEISTRVERDACAWSRPPGSTPRSTSSPAPTRRPRAAR